MLKKCLFVIAVIALLAVTVQAASIQYKGDPYPWPVEWKKVEICRIDILMEVGFWVEIKGCDKEILLVQRDCIDVGRDEDEWPCYKGCANIEVRTNFKAELDGDVSHSGLDMKHKERFNGEEPLILSGDGKWHEVEACVIAYKIELWDYEHAAGVKEKIGYLKVRVKPDVSWDKGPPWN